ENIARTPRRAIVCIVSIMSSTSIDTGEPLEQTSDDLEVVVSNLSADIWTRLKAAPPVARAFFGLVPTLAIFFLFFLLSRAAIDLSQLYILTGLVCLAMGGTVIARLRLARERTILAGFAQANGYTFDEHGAVDQAYGTLFSVTD